MDETKLLEINFLDQITIQMNIKEEITPEQIQKLEKKWGDLDVINTLFSRYYRARDWRKELPVLGILLKSAINDSFHTLKYEGNENYDDKKKAEDQLECLDDKQKSVWKKNPSSVRVLSYDGEFFDQPISKATTRILEELFGKKEEGSSIVKKLFHTVLHKDGGPQSGPFVVDIRKTL
jgi:hypothetical protein